MQLLHHQPQLRELDGVWVCSRCGLVNPTDDQPCIPLHLDPAANRSDDTNSSR